MRNIIKSLRYQTVRDNVTYYSILAALYFLLIPLFEGVSKVLECTASEYMVLYGFTLTVAITVAVIMFATRICGWDYSDKTMNYEILIGHSRKEVYFARVIVALGWSMAVSAVLLIVPLSLFTLINGWGDNTEASGVILRCILVIFPAFRLFCECVLFTFILKSCYIGLLVSFLFSELSYSMIIIICEVTKTEIGNYALISSVSNMDRLFNISDFTITYVNGEDIQFFSSGIEPLFGILTVAVSLAVGIGCLMLGYLYFSKSDMK